MPIPVYKIVYVFTAILILPNSEYYFTLPISRHSCVRENDAMSYLNLLSSNFHFDAVILAKARIQLILGFLVNTPPY